ncbi:OmpA family protein [Myxococcota bacterium]|nr:OmpA family protein [Myxococcota bacterium]
MKTRSLLGALCGALLISLSAARAQDIQNFEPAVGSWNYFSVEGAQIGPAGQLVPSLYINYGHKPLALKDKDDKVLKEIINGLTTFDLLASYSINDRFEVGIAVPLSLISEGDGLKDYGAEGGFALHDIRLIPKAHLYGGEGDLFQLAFSIPIALPTGDAKKFAGDDTTSIQPRIIAELDLKAARLAANVGYRYRMDNPKAKGIELTSDLTYGVGAAAPLGHKDWVGIAEVFGAAPFSEAGSGDMSTKPLEMELGVRHFTSWCGVFNLGGGLGLIDDYGSPEFRAFAGFGWHCRSKDRDEDGVPNDVDQCPEIPEDRDGFEDNDGCPDEDNDKDGILDKADKCPKKAEDMDNFEDNDGCPDEDNDKDGVKDGDDKCPLIAEDNDKFEDEDGCPDEDNDKDGIKDGDDKCPMQAEDPDKFQDEDGCPDLDNDKDGVPDAQDKCPLQPEVINGVDDEDGCPDEGESKVKLTTEKIEILDKVFFDTGKSIIKEKSFNMLNQVAATLKAKTEIKKLRIEGHTDNRGKAADNLTLSQNRARAVYRYLISRGVQEGRLEFEGYGSDKPLVPHKQRGAAEKNRRVEFSILEQEGLAVEAAPAAKEKTPVKKKKTPVKKKKTGQK